MKVLFTVGIMWIICYILTLTDAVEPGDPIRTDLKDQLIHDAAWIRFPYPCEITSYKANFCAIISIKRFNSNIPIAVQWGTPVVTLSGVLGLIAGVVSSAVESVGDYYACARMSGAPQPPSHAVNRGIGTEGFGCVLAALWGTGSGTTSYSENIGVISVTRVSHVDLQRCKYRFACLAKQDPGRAKQNS